MLDSLQSIIDNDVLLFKFRNLIYSFLISHRTKDDTFVTYTFYYSEINNDVYNQQYPNKCINLYDLQNRYPNQYLDRLSFVLTNLNNQYPLLGYIINDFDSGYLQSRQTYHESSNFDARLFCCLTNDRITINQEIHQILRDLRTLNYINVIDCLDSLENPDSINSFTISLEGKILIEKNQQAVLNQGFIAISFSEEARKTASAIIEGIKSAGYAPKMISDKEYNGQIVQEIFYEISRSLFVVMDSSDSNNGAYYEAGYAKGIKVPVIYTCRRDVFENKDKEGKYNKPHFDIQQENHILWTNETDLTNKLKKRIEASMGLK
jgi:nucleoside 2-deoxyribosyltransferase